MSIDTACFPSSFAVAPRPANEDERQEALHKLRLLDTLPEQTYDDIVLLAAQICDTPISMVSLIDNERQWFKARLGLDVPEIRRDGSFCSHAILQPEKVMLVPDTLEDLRFCESPMVSGDPHIRFYAGAPIVTPDGAALGTVCVIDKKPRELSARQQFALQALARQASALFQLRARVFFATH